jgi:hypothetical protein
LFPAARWRQDIGGASTGWVPMLVAGRPPRARFETEVRRFSTKRLREAGDEELRWAGRFALRRGGAPSRRRGPSKRAGRSGWSRAPN